MSEGSAMTLLEKAILEQFKALLRERLQVYKVILFGSRARGDADPQSDLDVVVVLEDGIDASAREYVSDCAWEAGFVHGIVVVPVVFTRSEWEYGPERESLFVRAVETEGVPV
jgi:predicted nucleotidyltransferase